MEASPAYPCNVRQSIESLEAAHARNLASRGIHQPVETLIAGQTYDIVYVHRRLRDIFVVSKHTFYKQFKIIRLPRRCHETFNTFFDTIREFYVKKLYFVFTGFTDDGEPVFFCKCWRDLLDFIGTKPSAMCVFVCVCVCEI